MPAITLPTSDWVDLYAAASITPGTPILVQNQGANFLLIQESPSDPGTADQTGRMVARPSEVLVNQKYVTGAWARSFGGLNIYVQRN